VRSQVLGEQVLDLGSVVEILIILVFFRTFWMIMAVGLERGFN